MHNKIDFSVFTELKHQQYLVSRNQNILILDITYPDWFKKELISLPSQQKFIFVETDKLSKALTEMIKKEVLFCQNDNCRNTLLVFPGNGACFVKDSLPNEIVEKFSQTSVFAKRGWYDTKNPLVVVGEIMPQHLLMLDVEKILVIDDVISSGSTMRKLYNRNHYKFPRADWFAATWLMQYPRTKTPSGIKGFRKIITMILVEGKQGQRVPINSLSTLLQDSEIAENYAVAHFKKPMAFLKLLANFGR